MSNYDWRVQVRITGTRDGWSKTLVDTPVFELRSNAQFGSIWPSANGVAKTARDMFANLVQPDDQIHVIVCAAEPTADHDPVTAYTTAFTFGGNS
jgi:hypothetical protein